MREIKFRAWDTNRELMIDSSLIQSVNYANDKFVGITLWEEYSENDVFAFRTIPAENLILEQYTGLEDTSGNPLDWWEGDLLQVGRNTKVVVFENGCFWAKSIHRDWYIPLRDIATWSLVKKTGNIHENPELLKDEKQEA